MTDAFIGIDIGTSGCRIVAIDQFGQILAEQTYCYDRPQLRVAANGETHAEQDPQWLWTIVAKLLKQLLAICQSTIRVQAIAVDATSGSILLTDKHGQPLSPILLYNDSRAQWQSKRIADVAPDNSAAHGTASGLSKLNYLQKTLSLPNQYHLLHQAAWINFKLGAPVGISDENNALKTGYDPVAQQWPDWLTPFRGKATLPKVVTAGTKIGYLSETLAKQFGIKNQPSIIAGTTDSIAAFLATDAHKVGDAVTSLGSSLVIKQLNDKPVFKPGQGIYSHRLGNKWLVGGASNTGGAVLKFFSLIYN